MPAGLMMEDAAEEGKAKFTGENVIAEGLECEHMVFLVGL